MNDDSSRRRFLELAGTGTAFSIAGCSGLGDESESINDQTGDSTTLADTPPAQTSEEETSVGIAVSGDQEQLQREQQRLQSEMQSGNLSQEEATQQYQEVQAQLRSEAIATFQSNVQSMELLSIEDSLDQFGILLVTGTPAALIETVSFDEVQALVSESRFQQAKAQAEQQNESG